MYDYQKDFIKLAIEKQVISFGDFVLKSGRKSPYFFNMGQFHTGDVLTQLGQFYAECILAKQLRFDVIFGPAYKGIPLVCATAMALSQKIGEPIPFCFNRKEAKTHGEKGMLIGAPLSGKVLIIDDVITAGTAIRHSMDLIKNANATPAGIVIAFDRQEKGQSDLSAVKEIEQSFSVPIYSVAQFNTLIQYFSNKADTEVILDKLQAYHKQFGFKEN